MSNRLVWVVLGLLAVLLGVFMLSGEPDGFGTVENPKQAPKEYIQALGPGELCVQVIAKARKLDTGEVFWFPTPCGVPDEGWEIVR